MGIDVKEEEEEEEDLVLFRFEDDETNETSEKSIEETKKEGTFRSFDNDAPDDQETNVFAEDEEDRYIEEIVDVNKKTFDSLIDLPAPEETTYNSSSLKKRSDSNENEED